MAEYEREREMQQRALAVFELLGPIHYITVYQKRPQTLP